jgi:hypothetical protein
MVMRMTRGGARAQRWPELLALVVATLTLHCITTAMPTTTTADAWSPERIDRLARAMYPLIFGRAAPATAAAFPSGAAQLQQIGLTC